jgi:hypothetical protein
MRKNICKTHGKHHVPSQIVLRGKDDSYYVECSCGVVGDEGLVAIWFEKLPAWGLDEFGTMILHESFARMKMVQHLSLQNARRKRK